MEQQEKRLTQEELDSLKELNQKYNTLMFSLGEAEIQIEDLKEKLEKAKMERNYLINDYLTIKEKSLELTTKLSDKYGSAKINLDTGKIESI